MTTPNASRRNTPDQKRNALSPIGLLMARKYLEECLRSSGKAEIQEFATTMQMKKAEAKKYLVAAQSAMGQKDLV